MVDITNNKKRLTLLISGIIGLVVITAGVTYAFFNYAKEGTTDNSITTGTITFLYTEVDKVGAGISIEDALPTSDAVGKALTGEGNVFNFKVTANTKGKASIPYEVTARKKSDSTLDEEAVRVYLTEVDGSEEELLLDNYNNLIQTTKVDSEVAVEKTIYTGKVYAGTEDYEKNFRLRMWIGENIDYSDGEYNDKTFTLTVNVYANTTVVTDSEIAEESRAEITSIAAGDTELIPVENEAYHYEISLPNGTISTIIEVETESVNAKVDIEKVSSLENINSTKTYNIKKLAISKALDLDPGDNYFRITVTSVNGKVVKQYVVKITVNNPVYKEAILNGAEPVLTNNLIPVVISNDGTVKKANEYEEWYKYENKIWANAVLINEDVRNTYIPGDVINKDKILAYFVWIPRYAYKVTSGYHTTTAGIMDIVFLNKKSNNNLRGITVETSGYSAGVKDTSNNYFLHPAFNQGGEEINGFWVAKFEPSNTYTDIKVVPGIIPLINGVTISQRYQFAYDMRSNSKYGWNQVNVDPHMMTNYEWGAVAYLTQSVYGRCTGSTCTEVSHNPSAYAGGGEGGAYITNTDQSTTGNITGIYDLSGGMNEYVASYVNNGDGSLTTYGGNVFGATSEYKNEYIKSSVEDPGSHYTANQNIYGDAVYETSNYEYPRTGWYKDTAWMPYSNSPFFSRGGDLNGNSYGGCGIFSFYNGNGQLLNVNFTFRPVVRIK